MANNPILIPMTVAADSEALSVSAAVAVVAGNAALGTKSITSNGIYNAASDGYDGYSSVDVSVSGGSSTLITKNISANGTYNASSDSADGYSQVTVAVPASAVDSGTKSISTNGTHDVVGYANANVNVPNSYSAGDEGKVVSNGALVAQTSDTVTTNDTYDTTLINSLTVNVSGGGDAIIRQLKDMGTDGLRYATLGETVFFESLKFAGTHSLANLTETKTIVFPKLQSCSNYPFSDNDYLKTVDIGSTFTQASLSTWFFSNDLVLDTIILRRSTVPTLPDINCFYLTPFASGGTGGTLYVPQSLLSQYSQASNWSTILGYANNSIVAIEGSQYENYYADGTAIS